MTEITTLLKELIRFKTTAANPPEIQNCSKFIESYLEEHRISYERFDHKGVPSILVSPGKREARVLLMSHMDVVDADDSQFEPFEKDGCLYGRGTIDDKYAVAISLVLVKNHLEKLRSNGGSQDDLSFGVLITGDEEIGGMNGAGHVLPLLKTEFCVTLDGGCVDRMVIREKGMAKVKLVASGRSAHGARPWLGVNAVDTLVDDLVKVRGLFQDREEGNWHKTVNTGIIRGGEAHNQVPDSAEAWLDIRYTENDDIEKIISAIQERVSSRVSVVMKEPLFTSPPSSFKEALLEISPSTITCSEHGASDARYLTELDIPGVIWGADGNMSQHSSEEHVSLASISRLYGILDNFVSTI